MKKQTFKLIASLIAAAAIQTQTSLADTIVAPGSLTSTEGNSNNRFPFFSISAMRYQQVYGASLFASLPVGGVTITGIKFRLEQFESSFSSTLPDIQLDLSTTSAGENTLSTTFASNVGVNDTIVYARGALALSGTGGGSPNPFDVTITFSTPFQYNPGSGNLLLDVRNYGGSGSAQYFDATSVSGDSIGRIYANDVNSATSFSPGSEGLVTMFVYQLTPVPEPGTLAIAGLGVAGLLAVRRRA